MHALAILVLLVGVQRAGTLGAELLARNLPVPPAAADLEQPITSYSVLDDAKGFVIAYYGVEPDGMLHGLRIRSYDNTVGAWRYWTRPEPIGSILSLKRHGGFLYVGGHSSPSAAPLLVLTERLTLVWELDGWPRLMLGDGRVVFQRSMVHFAPAHAAALAVYDPAANREIALYPPLGSGNERGIEQVAGTGLWVERSIGEVRATKAGTIEFSAIEQHMRLDAGQTARPAAPERRLTISCNIGATPPLCRRIPD